jgi:hypothetical protein
MDTHPTRPTPRVHTYLSAHGDDPIHLSLSHKANQHPTNPPTSKHTHTIQRQTHSYNPFADHQARRPPCPRRLTRADFQFHKKHLPHHYPAHSHKQEYMWGYTTPAFSRTTPLLTTPCEDNSLATDIWQVATPRCRDSDKTGTTVPCKFSSPSWNVTSYG